MFDLTVHKRDKKGKVIAVQPYRLYCRGNRKIFERPPGSGNFFSPDGTLVEAGKEMKEEAEVAAKQKRTEEIKQKALDEAMKKIARETEAEEARLIAEEKKAQVATPAQTKEPSGGSKGKAQDIRN